MYVCIYIYTYTRVPSTFDSWDRPTSFAMAPCRRPPGEQHWILEALRLNQRLRHDEELVAEGSWRNLPRVMWGNQFFSSENLQVVWGTRFFVKRKSNVVFLGDCQSVCSKIK